jgi:hypothetical protein
MNVAGRRGYGGERRQCGRVQAADGGNVVEVYELRHVAVLNSDLGTHVLVLAVVVFAALGTAYGGEALLIERVVVPTTEMAAEPENQKGLHSGLADPCSPGHVASLPARANRSHRLGRESGAAAFRRLRRGHLRERLSRRRGPTRGPVSSDDVVVQDGLQTPPLFPGHLREGRTTVQTLLFAGYGEEDEGRGKIQLAQDARTLETHCSAAAVVVRTGSISLDVVGVAVARVLVPADQHGAFCGSEPFKTA